MTEDGYSLRAPDGVRQLTLVPGMTAAPQLPSKVEETLERPVTCRGQIPLYGISLGSYVAPNDRGQIPLYQTRG